MTATLTRPRFAVCWCTDATHDQYEHVDTLTTRDAAEAVAALDHSGYPRVQHAHVTEAAA